MKKGIFHIFIPKIPGGPSPPESVLLHLENTYFGARFPTFIANLHLFAKGIYNLLILFDIWQTKYVQNFRNPNPQNVLDLFEFSIKFSTDWYILSIFVKSLKYLSNSLNHLSNHLSESTTWFSTKKYMMVPCVAK